MWINLLLLGLAHIFPRIYGDAATDYNDVNSDGSFSFGLSNDDIGGHYHTAAGSADKIVRGRYGSRNPANGRIEETVYTAGPRGYRAQGPQIHRKMDLSQYPRGPVGSPDDPLADPYDDPSYHFDFKTHEYDRTESADSTGRVRGLYSYLDDIGERHTVRYAAGAGTGFEVLNSVPDSPASVAFSTPLYKAPAETRGRMSVQRGPDGQYKFILSGPDQRRSESSGPDGVVRGSYSYLDDKGIQRTVQYIAGAGIGYRIVQSTTGAGTHNAPRPALPQYGIRDYQSNDLSDDSYLHTAESEYPRPKGDSNKNGFEPPRGGGLESGGGGRGGIGGGSRGGVGGGTRGGSVGGTQGGSGGGTRGGSRGGTRGGSGGGIRGGIGTGDRSGGSGIGKPTGHQDESELFDRPKGSGGSDRGVERKSGGPDSARPQISGGDGFGSKDNFDQKNRDDDFGRKPTVGGSSQGGTGNIIGGGDRRPGVGSFVGEAGSRAGFGGSGEDRKTGIPGGSNEGGSTFSTSGEGGYSGASRGGSGGRKPGSGTGEQDGGSAASLGGKSPYLPRDKTTPIRGQDDGSYSRGNDFESNVSDDGSYRKPSQPGKPGGGFGGRGESFPSRSRPSTSGGSSGSRKGLYDDYENEFPLVTADHRRLELDREKDWSLRGRDSTVIKNVGRWYIGLPPGSAVRAHVQNIDLLPLGGRIPSPSEALRRDEISKN